MANLKRHLFWIGPVGALALGALITAIVLSSGGGGRQAAAAVYVGRDACVDCHQIQHQLWTGSHHDLAMDEATEQNVLGDFNDATFTHFGVTSRFFKRNGQFIVNTEGPDGKLHDYPVKYVFGVTPLQQYLIEFPGGRLQCLTIAWDTRPRIEGGQRWYHLYPDEKIEADDWLHWTQRGQNWNYMCADCHSTNLKKNYDAASDSYHTTWSEIDVSCEACHGPGSNHLQWAKAYQEAGRHMGYENKGLVVRLKSPEDRVQMTMDPEKGLQVSFKDPGDRTQVEACARCHARRDIVAAPYHHRGRLMDWYQPAMLLDELYHADGQIDDEVYVYGSFAQSKMYHVGVRCTDCHDPHSLNLHAPGNALCIRCHQADKFDTPTHHHHPIGTEGAQCVSCHMPGKKYMVVDFRRDHSLRIPRPDLSVKLGTPNACTMCHADQDASWAAEAAAQWWPELADKPHYATAFDAARQGARSAEPQLIRIAGDLEAAPIVRATALYELRQYPGDAATQAMIAALRDGDPFVRYAAVGGLNRLPPERFVATVAPLLSDPVRSVRNEAASLLSVVPRQMLADHVKAFDSALAEYKAALDAVADNRGGQMGLGVLYSNLGQLDRAETAYKTAIAWDSRFLQAKVNLAHVYNQTNRNEQAEKLFREVLAAEPQFGEGWYSLGLLIAENPSRLAEATEILKKAAELLPNHPRAHYNYALALQQTGRMNEAEAPLLRAVELTPDAPDIIYAACIYYIQRGNTSRANQFIQHFARVAPNDPRLRSLMGGPR